MSVPQPIISDTDIENAIYLLKIAVKDSNNPWHRSAYTFTYISANASTAKLATTHNRGAHPTTLSYAAILPYAAIFLYTTTLKRFIYSDHD